MMRLALYQPDIPQNVGAMLRLGACFKVPVDIIEPCGFPLDDKRLRRVALDYRAACETVRHPSWEAFLSAVRSQESNRLVLLTTAASDSHADFKFEASDTLLLGRESRGVPKDVHEAVHARVRIPISGKTRSLNVVTAAAIAISEALRQLGAFSSKTML